MLRDNGRMSFTEIGEELGISRVAVKKRVQKLEEAGVIRGYKAVICREDRVKMFIEITTVNDNYISLLAYLDRTGYVTELYIMEDANRIHATAVASDVSVLEYLAKSVRKKFADTISQIETHTVNETVKDTFGGVTMIKLNEDVAREMNKYLKDTTIEEILLRRKELFHYKVYFSKVEMANDIDVLDLSPRSYNCLKRAGVHTVGDLINNFDTKPGATSRKQLRGLKNLGQKSADEILMNLFYYHFLTLPEKDRASYMKQLKNENP